MHRLPFQRLACSAAIFLISCTATPSSEQAQAHDTTPTPSSGFTTISSLEGLHDNQRLNFAITFVDPLPIEGGLEFQLFFDVDSQTGTGYGLGYEAVLRGVQLLASNQLDFLEATGGTGPGGWGPSLGNATFTQTDPFDLLISIPRVQPLPTSGAVRFGIEIYRQGALVDSASGLSTKQAPFEDCNANGIADSQEIADGLAADCNGNGTPDSCDVASGQSTDCNQNGSPDSCDLASLLSEDCTGNTIPDECEPDCNKNGQADSCDVLQGVSTDCDLNGVPDECAPLAVGWGPKHLAIHPAAGSKPIAIRLRAAPSNTEASCLDAYVQSDGSLGTRPAFFTPDQWCTVFAFDAAIIADRSYTVDFRATDRFIASAEATTWIWGDLDNSGRQDIVDVVVAILAASGGLPERFLIADVSPCTPDGSVDIVDIVTTILAMTSQSVSDVLCAAPCP